MNNIEKFPTRPPEILKNVLKQIGALIPGLLEDRAPATKTVNLRESFAAWEIPLYGVEESLAPKAQFPAREAGYWHHQLMLDEEVAAHAESEPRLRPRRVRRVTISPLAKKIDDAITWVDRHEGELEKDFPNVSVRFLAIPSILIYAFWLVEPKKVYVIDAFSAFKSLKAGQLLDEKEFLKRMIRDLKHII